MRFDDPPLPDGGHPGLGAANAYLGMKAGLTVAATFPAAVVAGNVEVSQVVTDTLLGALEPYLAGPRRRLVRLPLNHTWQGL